MELKNKIKDYVQILFFLLFGYLLGLITGALLYKISNENNINNKLELYDTTYNKIILDSIQYNIIKKDSIIYNLKNEMNDEIDKVNKLDDSSAFIEFQKLVSE